MPENMYFCTLFAVSLYPDQKHKELSWPGHQLTAVLP
jgi:hypothetical protein